MKKILLIPVGGTICTSQDADGILSVNKESGYLIKSNFEKSDSVFAKEIEFDVTDNLMILSEDMTVSKWNLMIDTYRENISRKSYDGVIIAHGTDTLAYSAALFSILLAETNIPVFFVSANENLASPRSNGNQNFRCAVECICHGITANVYVAYQNPSDNKMYLHVASRLTQCKNYSEDFFSCNALDISEINEQNFKEFLGKLDFLYPNNKRKAFFDLSQKIVLKNCVLKITPYVGTDYDAYNYSKFSAVLHGSYHSGTACTQKGGQNSEYDNESVLHLLDICSALSSPIDVYLSPSKLSGGIYESTAVLAAHGGENSEKIHFIYGFTDELTYAKLVLAYSLIESNEEREIFINTECNFENIA